RPPYTRKKLEEGDSLFLEITLLGETTNYWEFISQSFSGVINIGKERYLKLQEIQFYHPFEEKHYPVKSFIPTFHASQFLEKTTQEKDIFIRLYPTSLKAGGSFVRFDQFNRDIFVKAVVSRISQVAVNYGTKEGRIFIDRERIQLKDLQMRPSPMKRWSNRKKTHMVIPAFEGSFRITGDINHIYPYLKVAEVINLGKSVSFGLGRLQLKQKL
ncbi:MAG: CRISPR system precrRNA processing endoribonuclease RAMP protein Cas6, partial [Aquificae bacterium]|nr:CRISPR system precrRNA processing endoribonuclease RAMP protein Cas6 [Aquificota bacterium]